MNIFYRGIPEILSRSFGTKFFSIMLIAILATSCNESSVLGLDVQPESDLLNVGWTDTTTLLTKTVKEDSLHTDNSIIVSGDALIGKYMDPIFGNTSASLYTQLKLPTNNPTFGVNPVCDSIVLAMVYSPTYYGKKGRLAQNINVYQLNDALTGNSYHSDNSVSYNNGIDLADNHAFVPDPYDSVHVGGSTLKPQLRVPLKTSFGQSILEGNLSLLANNTAFQSIIKGLYITTENTFFASGSGDGNIMYFKMEDAQTKVSIYYHYTIQTVITHIDSTIGYQSYDLGLGSVTRFSKFNHDFNDGYSYLQSQLHGTSVIDTTVFIQAMAGTKVKIEFPYLKNFNDSGKVAINRAELVIRPDKTNPLFQVDTFNVPAKLVLYGIGTDGTNFVIQDSYEANETFDGEFNTTTQEYRFNIDRYVQQVLNGSNTNSGLYLVVSGGAVYASRIALGGGKNLGSSRMKLNLTYTKLH